MQNPFQLNQSSFLSNKLDREIKKQIYDKVLKNYRDNDCIYTQLSAIKSFDELSEVVGKIDIHVVLNQVISKISSFSPANFNDFIQVIDETSILLSCLWAETAPKVDNRSTPGKPFNWKMELDELILDFFADFRKAILDALKTVVLLIVQRFFLDILNYIDCNKINKCIVPCSQERNPYKTLFGKVLIKEGKNTLSFLESKVKKFDFDLSRDEFKKYFNYTIENLTPDEIECLLNGVMSSNVVKFLIDLFKSLFGKDIDEIETVFLFDGFKDVVDVSFASSDLAPINPCGNLSLEALARIKLKNEGKTEQEIEDTIQTTISQNFETLTKLSDILQNISQLISFPEDSPNAEITKTIINNSIDSFFKSLDQIQVSNRSILKNILLSLTGETICAVYKTENANIKNVTLPDEIKNILDKQINFLPQNNSMLNFSNPLFFFSDINENFYSKYLMNYSGPSSPTIDYNDLNEINIYSGNDQLFSIRKFSISDKINDISIPLELQNITDYVGMTQRDNVYNLFQDNNDKLSDYFNIDLETTYIQLYKQFSEFLLKDLLTTFYFQEYSEFNKTNQNKKDFINLDYLEVIPEKENLKIRIKTKE